MRTMDWTGKEKRAKGMSIDELEYAITDCLAARDASKGWNPDNEGYYQDEASIYSKELRVKKQKVLDKERKNAAKKSAHTVESQRMVA